MKADDLLVRLKSEIERLKNPAKAQLLQGFFKTGKGEYAEGDIFFGITVPIQRTLAKKHQELPLKDIQRLLKSKVHEERLISLFMLVHNFKKGKERVKKQIYDLYLGSTSHINNWDLIDSSAPLIVGQYLMNKPKGILHKLAKSRSIWDRRISVLATFWFIRQGQFKDSINIATILLQDKHDLVQKAVGWMLREIGNRDLKTELKFLDQHYKVMPRTMLRYAIEKFPEKFRLKYLKRNG